MKTLIPLILLSLASWLTAGTVTLTWDPQPGIHFKVRKGVEVLATVTTNQVTLTLPDQGPTGISITALKPGGYGESMPLFATVYGFKFQATDLTRFEDLPPRYTLMPFIRWTP